MVLTWRKFGTKGFHLGNSLYSVVWVPIVEGPNWIANGTARDIVVAALTYRGPKPIGVE
jgi:hypothetical protein